MHCHYRPVAVLFVDPRASRSLTELFRKPPLIGWDLVIAESAEHARFLIQVGACDALLVDRDRLDADLQPLDWLIQPPVVPILFVSEVEPLVVQQALALGVQLWLPRSLLVDQPGLLAEALEHLRRATREVADSSPTVGLEDSGARIERLADLLWHALPMEGKVGWLSQRFMLERLHEELGRAERHGTPFSVLLAELALDLTASHPSAKGLASGDVESALRSWMADRVLRLKRRSDVVGQYGTQGFMLLLPHTGEQGAEEVCRRLRHDFARSPWKVHSSFGVAGYGAAGRTPKGLLRKAEERLDQEKEMHAQ